MSTTAEYVDFQIIENILKNHSISEVAKFIDVARGTVKRWIDLKAIPKQYVFDLLKLLDEKIDYSKFTSKEKDQFFTPEDTAKYCYNKFIEVITKYGDTMNDYYFIEPSAGDGSFLKFLPSKRTTALDIESKRDDIIAIDYFDFEPKKEHKKYVVIGNPPFGLRGNLALRFINHSAKFADYVAFILPQLFESDGKGVPRKRVIGYNLIHSEKLDTKFYEPDGNELKIHVVFQVWSKHHTNSRYEIKESDNNNFKVYSLSDGGSSSTTRNKNMLDKCHIYLPSTCFGKENMRVYDSFEELPGRKGYGIFFNENVAEHIKKCKDIDWGEVSFLSTNSAYNLRTSQIVKEINN